MIWSSFATEHGAQPMPKQPAFPGLKHAMTKKRTRREVFFLAIRGPKRRSATARRCAVLPGSNRAVTAFRTRPPSSTSAICRSGTGAERGRGSRCGPARGAMQRSLTRRLRPGTKRVRGLDTSTARLHDARVWNALLHGGETSVWAELPSKRRARGRVHRAGQGLGCHAESAKGQSAGSA